MFHILGQAELLKPISDMLHCGRARVLGFVPPVLATLSEKLAAQ
jgi:hypothetical protein